LSSQQNGYFLVLFDDSNVNEKVELKTMLHDFPERVIRFMWEKSSRSEKAMSYVERCAKGNLFVAGKKKKGFSGFRSLSAYIAQQSWKDDVGPQMQQQPPWDTKPIRKVNPRRGQVKKGPVRELRLEGKQGDSVEGGEQEDGVALGLGQQLGGGISTTKYNQPLHTSIKEVTVVPDNQDCMEEEADVAEMPVYLTDFDSDKES
jgi:hypothetical protein